MGKFIVSAAIVASAVFASPAFSTIIQVDPSSIQGANILFNDGLQTGTTVFGNTNLGDNTLVFTGTTLGGGTTIVANGGQSRIEGSLDGSTSNPNDSLLLTSLQFNLTDLATFNNLELNIFGGDATSATFNILDNAGQLFTFSNLSLGNGENRFGFQGIDKQTLRSVSVTLNGGGVLDFRQIRLDGFAAVTPGGAVPEPATWAMMIVGFGAVGFSVRSRSQKKPQLV